jgi:pyridoxamine 5'-phosphate oxidase
MQSITQNKQLETELWAQLLRASVDKHHEWRSPVLVTCGENNWPEARTVILRTINIGTKELTFYTDRRSPKVTQLLLNPNAILVFWSKRLNWQLRIKVTICVKTEGKEVNKVWDKVKQSPSAGDYLSAVTPGTLLEINPIPAEKMPTSNSHFAMLVASVIEIDWLSLNRNGHQRARIDADDFRYLAP